MKSFFRTLSSRFPFFVRRPNSLERAIRQSPKSRRLGMEPLENRALLAVDALGTAALADVGESWGPDPAPVFSASVLATDAAVIDVSGIDATSANATFSVQTATRTPVAPPSFEQLMESLGMLEIKSLDSKNDAPNDAASLSFLDEAPSSVATTQVLNSLALQDVSQGAPRQVVFYDSSAADFDASTLNLDDESVYYVDTADANNGNDATSPSVTPSSGGGNSGGSNAGTSNGGYLTTYGSSAIPESATFTGSGGSDVGPYFGFTTPVIPSGYTAYVLFDSGDAVYGEDYLVMRATIDSAGVVTPNSYPVSGGATPNGAFKLDFSGFQTETYCIVPRNDFTPESHEELVATLYLDQLSGGSDVDPPPVAYDSFTATIVDDDPANLAVYWRNGSNSTRGATLSGNPNGGGYRVFPEKVDSEAEFARDQVDVVFRLSASKSTDTVIHYKVLDPDNYISLGANQASDVNYAGDDNRYTPVFQGAVTIPANQLEAVATFVISDAYAGDNFIVVADTDSSAVASAALGTTMAERYRLVQPTTNQPAYSPLLTVWRTLWVERDQLTLAPNNVTQAGFPSIGGVVTSELARACIDVKDYAYNNVTSISASEFSNVVSQSDVANIGLPGRNSPQPTNNFWTVQVIGAFRAKPAQTILGHYGNNAILVYNWTLENAVTEWNQTNNDNIGIDEFKLRTVLHELGHAFSLEHSLEGIMYTFDDELDTNPNIEQRMETANLEFTQLNILKLQSQAKPS